MKSVYNETAAAKVEVAAPKLDHSETADCEVADSQKAACYSAARLSQNYETVQVYNECNYAVDMLTVA